MEKNKITIEATIEASLDKVWEYWTLPQHIVNWNFASNDWHCPKVENDVRTGGRFMAIMASKDGKMSFNFEGVYDKVVEKETIAYSLEDGRTVNIRFQIVGDKIKVIEIFDPENTNSEEMQRAGWQAILNNFKKYVETNSQKE